MASFKPQAGLGTQWERIYKEGQNVTKLVIARVKQVNYAYGTVDLEIAKTQELVAGYNRDNGKFSAKLPMEFGGINQYGKPYGTVTPVSVGSLVLVGFVDSNKQSPIVLGIYGDAYIGKELRRTELDRGDYSDTELSRDFNNSFKLFPSLTFNSIDGQGDRVATFTGKTFLVTDSNPSISNPVDDNLEGLQYEDLKVTQYGNGETIEPTSPVAPKLMFKHQGYMDGDGNPQTHNLIFFVDSDGTFRISSMEKEEEWRSYLEMGKDSSIKLRKQADSKEINRGSNISELGMSKDGVPYLRNKDMDLEVRPDGIYSQGKPFQGSGGGEGGGIPPEIQDQLDKLKDELGEANTTITILNGKIETKVSYDEIDNYFDEKLVELIEQLNKQKEDIEKDTNTIKNMAEDNMLDGAEKRELLILWERLEAEYPSILAQGKEYEVVTDKYTTAFEELGAYVKPYLENLDKVEDIDGPMFKRLFSTYFDEKLDVLNRIIKSIKDIASKALDEAKKASNSLTDALSDIANSQLAMSEIRRSIQEIARDGIATPKEKKEIIRFHDRAKRDFKDLTLKAKDLEIDTALVEQTMKELTEYLTKNSLITNELESAPIDGRATVELFYNFYTKYMSLQNEIYAGALSSLKEHEENFKSIETRITQTLEKIELVATELEKVGDRLTASEAKIEIMADQISQKVSKHDVGGLLDDTQNQQETGGDNLVVLNRLTSGLLDKGTGEVIDGKNNSLVTEYINVSPVTDYTGSIWKNDNINRITLCYYAKDKTFITGGDKDGTKDIAYTLKAPEDARYVRMSFEYGDKVRAKIEKGSRATAWRPSNTDILGDLDLAKGEEQRAITEAEELKKDSIVSKQAGTDSMNTVEEMAQDNRLEPTEKTKLVTMWDSIQAEYPVMLDHATYFGLSSAGYRISYETLKTYLEPLIKDPTVASSMVPETFKANFKAYYDERSKLWDFIVVKANNRVEYLVQLVKDAEQLAENVEPPGVQLMDGSNFRAGFFTKPKGDWKIDNKERLKMQPTALHTTGKTLSSLIMSPVNVVENDLRGTELTLSTYVRRDSFSGKLNLRAVTFVDANSAVQGKYNIEGTKEVVLDTLEAGKWVRVSFTVLVPIKDKDGKDFIYFGLVYEVPEDQTEGSTFHVGLPMISTGTTLSGWNLSAIDIQNGLDDKEPIIIKQSEEPSNPKVDMIWIDTSRTEDVVISYGNLIPEDETEMGRRLDINTGNVSDDPTGLHATTGFLEVKEPRIKVTGSVEFDSVAVCVYDKNRELLNSWFVEEPGDNFRIDGLHKDKEYVRFSATGIVDGEPTKADPSTWTALVTNEGKTIPGKKIDTVKRWTGDEWVPVSPTEIEQLGGMPGYVGDEIIERLQEAEQIITSSSITNIVLDSKHFSDLMDGKANSSDLKDFITQGNLDEFGEDYLMLLQEKLDEIGVKFTDYVTLSKLEQTLEEFNFILEKSGGVNLVKNSIGFNGVKYFSTTRGGENTEDGNYEGQVDDSKVILKPLPTGVNLIRNPSLTTDNKKTLIYNWAKVGVKPEGEANGNLELSFDAIPLEENPMNEDYGIVLSAKEGTAYKGYFTQSRIPTEPGVEYIVYFSAKGIAPNSVLKLNIKHKDDLTGLGDDATFTLKNNQDWQVFNYRFVATGEKTTISFGKSDYYVAESSGNMSYRGDSYAVVVVAGVQLLQRADMVSPDEEGSAQPHDDIFGVQGLPELEALGFPSGFRIRGQTGRFQKLAVPNDEYLTLSCLINNYSDATVGVSIVRTNERYGDAIASINTGRTQGYQQFSVTFKPDTSEPLSIHIGSTAGCNAIITGIMLNVGKNPFEWTPYPTEVYSENVKIDMGGIKVYNSDNSGYTVVNPQEFSGYVNRSGRQRRVFTLNGETTEVKKLKVEQMIEMSPFVLMSVTSGNNTGWAILPN